VDGCDKRIGGTVDDRDISRIPVRHIDGIRSSVDRNGAGSFADSNRRQDRIRSGVYHADRIGSLICHIQPVRDRIQGQSDRSVSNGERRSDKGSLRLRGRPRLRRHPGREKEEQPNNCYEPKNSARLGDDISPRILVT